MESESLSRVPEAQELMKEADATSDLGSRINALMILVGSIPKDAENDFHHYSYTSAEAVLEKVQNGLSKLELVVTPRWKILEWHGDVVVVHVTIIIRCAGSLRDTLMFEGMGSGTDKGDKAVMKACTAAYKYAWRDFLCIPFGDNPEADASTDRPQTTAAAPRMAPRPPANPKPESAWTKPGQEPLNPPMDDKLPGEESDQFFTSNSGHQFRVPYCECGELAAPWVKDGKFMARFYCAKKKGDPTKCEFRKDV
jgi:hypothetical protein